MPAADRGGPGNDGLFFASIRLIAASARGRLPLNFAALLLGASRRGRLPGAGFYQNGAIFPELPRQLVIYLAPPAPSGGAQAGLKP
jgi:hypothetical protein